MMLSVRVVLSCLGAVSLSSRIWTQELISVRLILLITTKLMTVGWIEMLLMPEIGRDQGLEMNSNKNLDTIRSAMAIPGQLIHVRSDKIQPRCMSSSWSWCCLDLPVIIDAVCVQLAASCQDKIFKANINVYHTFLDSWAWDFLYSYVHFQHFHDFYDTTSSALVWSLCCLSLSWCRSLAYYNISWAVKTTNNKLC